MDLLYFLTDSLADREFDHYEESAINQFHESDETDAALLSSSQPPWKYDPSSYLEDWDNDGVPNYLDDWGGPGQQSPLQQTLSSREEELTFNSEGHVDEELTVINEQVLGSEVIGNPSGDASFWNYQEGNNSCAIASQKGVLLSITGEDVPEEELVKLAYDNGWYDPATGTVPGDVGKVLETYGIPVDQKYDTSILEIANALEKGEKVIVGLDANEIWYPRFDHEGIPFEEADKGHAVWVTGIHQDEAGEWHVVLNDTGIKEGAGKMVALADFLNAWEDFGNFAAITNTTSGDDYAA